MRGPYTWISCGHRKKKHIFPFLSFIFINEALKQNLYRKLDTSPRAWKPLHWRSRFFWRRFVFMLNFSIHNSMYYSIWGGKSEIIHVFLDSHLILSKYHNNELLFLIHNSMYYSINIKYICSHIWYSNECFQIRRQNNYCPTRLHEGSYKPSRQQCFTRLHLARFLNTIQSLYSCITTVLIRNEHLTLIFQITVYFGMATILVQKTLCWYLLSNTVSNFVKKQTGYFLQHKLYGLHMDYIKFI